VKNPLYANGYSYKYLDSEWPEAEALAKKSPEYAIIYKSGDPSAWERVQFVRAGNVLDPDEQETFDHINAMSMSVISPEDKAYFRSPNWPAQRPK